MFVLPHNPFTRLFTPTFIVSSLLFFFSFFHILQHTQFQLVRIRGILVVFVTEKHRRSHNAFDKTLGYGVVLPLDARILYSHQVALQCHTNNWAMQLARRPAIHSTNDMRCHKNGTIICLAMLLDLTFIVFYLLLFSQRSYFTFLVSLSPS